MRLNAYISDWRFLHTGIFRLQRTDMIIFFRPNSLCRGQTAMSPMAVVQFGLAMSFCPLVTSAFISGTTSGMPSTKRNALELSITTGPSSPRHMFSACARLKSPSTARNTTSHSRVDSSLNSSTVTLPNSVSTSLPADRSEPKIRRLLTGKERFSRQPTISLPTAPVAPTIATFRGDAAMLSTDGWRDGPTLWILLDGARADATRPRDDVNDGRDDEGVKP